VTARTRVPAAALLVVVLGQGPAAAQQIEVAAVDTPLVISGWKGDSRGLVGDILLTARGGSVSEFYLLASELRDSSGEAAIGRDQVQLVEPATERRLDRNVPRNFRVRVDGADLPGTYRGTLEIRPAGPARDASLILPVKVLVRVRPAVTGVPSDTLKVQLARCGLTCSLVRPLLPAGWLQDTLRMYFENLAPGAVAITAASIVAKGEKTGYRPSAADIVLAEQGDLSFASNRVSVLTLVVDRRHIPPDRYTGVLSLALDGAEQPKRITLDLSLRDGPMLPLFMLALGVLLGRLVKYMQEGGQAQSTALGEVRRVEARLADADPADATALRPMLQQVRQAVYDRQLTSVHEDLNAIGGRQRKLTQLRALEFDLQRKGPLPPAIGNRIQQARTLLANEQDDAADKELEGIRQDIVAGAAARGAPAGFPVSKALGAVQPGATSMWRGFVRMLNVLSGHANQFGAEATYWLARPLLWLLLLFSLVAVGFGSLYLEKGVTFGAEPFSDYFGLLIWGLSADVISRGLTNLQGAS
jgi:hypothetical protein